MRPTILLAEDDSLVSNFVIASLEPENLNVLRACSADEALEFSRNQTHIDLLLTDVRMGDDMSGVALAEQIIEKKPGIKVLVMSGYPDNELLASEKHFSFLAKPFTPTDLVERVRGLLSKIPAQSERKSTKRMTV